MTPKQITEMLKLLSKHFVISICSDMTNYIITMRLYPTDRNIYGIHATFKEAFKLFCDKLLEHTSGNLHKEIKDILK